jgi:hypothetical protein
LVPISEKMKKGQAPLRTFGDLLQFSRYQEGGEEALAALGVGKQEEKKARPKPKPAQQPSPEAVLKGDAAAPNDGQRSPPEDRSLDASCVADVAEPSQTSAASLTTPTAEQPATETSPSAEKPEPSESPS